MTPITAAKETTLQGATTIDPSSPNIDRDILFTVLDIFLCYKLREFVRISKHLHVAFSDQSLYSHNLYV